MDFFLGILANLISAAIGASAVFIYDRWLRFRRTKIARWFWNPLGAKEVQLFIGSRARLLGSEHRERFLTVSDAEVLGRLSSFLEEFFDRIVVVREVDEIDWTKAVVSVGGGNANRLFQNIDISNYPEFRYDNADHYTIENRDGSQRYSSFEPVLGTSSSSHAVVGKFVVRNDRSRTSMIVIAGAFGPSTLQAAIHLTGTEELKEIHAASQAESSLQAVLRVVHDETGTYSSELAAVTPLESLDRDVLLNAAPRAGIPEKTAEAAKAGVDSPQSGGEDPELQE